MSAPALEGRGAGDGQATTSAEITRLPNPTTAPTQGDRRSSSGFVGVLVATDLVTPTVAIAINPALALPVGVATVVAAVVWRATGLYQRRFSLSALDDLPRIWLGLAAGLGAVVALATWIDLAGGSTLAIAAALTLPVTRGIVYRAELGARQRGLVGSRRIAVLGDDVVADELARRIGEHPELGGELVGFVGTGPQVRHRTLGSLDEFGMLASHHRFSDLMVTATNIPPERMAKVLAACDLRDIDVYEVSGLQSLRWSATSVQDQVWGIPIRLVRPQRPETVARMVKRLLDVFVAGTAVVVLAPLLLTTAAAVRLEGGPGVIFKQSRVGRDGRVFTVYKFRSLRPATSIEAVTTWSVAGDPRIGPVGRFIRKTSIDELPQLVNVLKGEMSLVGPRPERPHFVNYYVTAVPHYARRHRVPVGMTGYAAVHGLRGDTSIEDRAVFDNIYIENWSLWLDIKILVRTVSQVLRGTGA